MPIVVYDFDNEMDNIEEPKEPYQVKLMEDNNEDEDDYKPEKSEEKSTHIIFIYKDQPYPLKVEENEKLKDVINRYVSEIEENLDNF